MLMQEQAPQLRKAEISTSHKPCVHLFLGQKNGFRRQNAGFSLIEMLVVISIIGLVLAIGVGVAVKITGEARREQTRAMMNGLLSANDEYKAIRGTEIGLGGSGSSTSQYVEACLEIKTCEEIMMSALNSSSSAALERTYKNGTIFDRWGTEIEYRTSNDSSPSGTNGPANEAGNTVDHEDLPTSRDPFFASAGPDETWGTDDDITTLQN